MAILERNSPDIQTDEKTAHGKVRELAREDQAHSAQVLTGTLETRGGSVSGRMATGAALSAENVRIAQQKDKEGTAKIIYAQNVLRDTLRQIDERIAQLEKEIAELEQRFTEAEERSQVAFERMHELEDLLEDIEDSGLTDTKRADLKHFLGAEAENVSDEMLLLEIARTQMGEEQRIGIAAHTEAGKIRHKIDERTQVRDDLIQARDDIMNDPDASPEEKTARAKDVLNRSFETNLSGAERVRDELRTETNRKAEETRDEQRTELTEADTFEMDEDMTLDETISPTLLGPK